MYKTITELSKDIGVSRQAVHQAIDKVLDKDSLNKKGNAFILNDKQQAKVKKYFNIEDTEPSSKESSELSRTLQIFTTELEVKNQQIKQLHKQISELHILLLREKENNTLPEGKDSNIKEVDPEKEPTKRKWYQIFKRD